MKKKLVTLQEYTDRMNRILEDVNLDVTAKLIKALEYAATVTLKVTVVRKDKRKRKCKR